MSQFGPNSNKPINIFNETPGFADEATEAFLSQDIDFSDPMQVQRAAQALNDLNIDVPKNLQGQITSQQALQDRIYTLQAKRAQQMVDLNVMVNKSRVDFNERVQSRYGQVEDDKGNPQFGTLQEDVGKIGKEIMNFNAQSLQDPVTKERYLALFGNEIKNQQIDAKGQARTQQLNYMRSSYDVQHNGLLALAKSNSLMDGGLLIKDFSQQLAVGVDQGVLSEQEAVEKEQNFRKALAKDKVTTIKEEFDLNTKQVLDAAPGTSPEEILQGMNPLGKYKAQFLAAGQALNRAAGLTENKDGTSITKISDIKPGGIPKKQFAADGKTKNPRVRPKDLFTADRINENSKGSFDIIDPSDSEIITAAKLSAKRKGLINKEDIDAHVTKTVNDIRNFRSTNVGKGKQLLAVSADDKGNIKFRTGKPGEISTKKVVKPQQPVKSPNSAFYKNLGTGAERSIRSPEQVKADSVLVTRGPIESSARIAKANEKTAIENTGTVEGLNNSIQQAETKIDELEKQGIMLPNESRKLKEEIRKKYNTMLKTAAASRAKEAGRRVKVNAALEKTVTKNIEAVMSSLEEGKPISPDQLASLEDSIANTPFESKYQQRINKAKAMSVYSNLSQAGRQWISDAIEGPLREDFKKLSTKLEESYIKDPVKSLVDQGFMEIQPLDFNADNLGEQLEVREVIAEVTESQTGRVNSGLTNQEIKDFTKAFEGADSVTKAHMLGQISTAMSPRAARELYASFDKKGQGHLAAAGSFYSQGGEGIQIADTILAGNEVLKNKEFKGMKELNSALTRGILPTGGVKDPVTGLAKITTFGAIANAFTKETEATPLFPDSRAFKGMERQVMDRVKLAYAGLTAEEGDLANESVSGDRLERAVTIALGREPLTIGGKGSKVLRPDLTTDSDQVNNMLMNITKADIGKLGGIKGLDNILKDVSSGMDSAVTRLFMKDAEYTSLGPGKYGVSVNGMALLTHDGEEFVLDINILTNKEGKVSPKSKTMQEALASKQMLSQIQEGQEQYVNDVITDIMAHNNIIQTTEGLKDISHMAVDDIDAAFQVGTAIDVVPEDVIAFYEGQTNDVGEVGLPVEEFSRLATEHGHKYGITEDMSYSSAAQMAMTAELFKEISTTLEKEGIPATVRDVRAAQVLGKNTAIKLIKAIDIDPNTPVDEVFSASEIAKFPELYSGDVIDVFYKITDLAFEDEAFEQVPASGFVFTEDNNFDDEDTGVFQ